MYEDITKKFLISNSLFSKIIHNLAKSMYEIQANYKPGLRSKLKNDPLSHAAGWLRLIFKLYVQMWIGLVDLVFYSC